MAVLFAEPTGWASWNARITTAGVEVTRLSVSLWKSHGAFRLEGEEYVIEPRGFWRTSADLKRGSTVIARVEKPSFMRRRFEITSAGHRLRLESESWRGRDYALMAGGRKVGQVTREGFTGRKIRLEFPDEVPLVLQVLLTYLVLVQVKREMAATSSGG